MPSKQGDVGLLHDLVAQHLLQAKGLPIWRTTGTTARPALSRLGPTGTERNSRWRLLRLPKQRAHGWLKGSGEYRP